MSETTIFERIINKEIPAEIAYEDDQCLAFHDIHAKAPVHVLIIPKKPIPRVSDLTDEDAPLIGHLWLVIRRLAEELGLENGYRVVVNCGPDGGQEVEHLHYHLMGGRAMTWPPG